MTDTTSTLNGLLAAHTPLQQNRCGDAASAAAGDNSVFKVAAPWSFLPNTPNLFSSLAEGTFGAPQPSADYEKKVIEWVPPTPSDSSVPSWETPTGLPRPQPQKVEMVELVVPSSPPRTREESPIDVVNTSAFAPPTLEATADPEIPRPLPLRLDSVEGVNSLSSLMMPTEQPTLTLATAFGMPSEGVATPTEPGPSSSEHQSPPSKGCYTRAPGLGPPTETPTSSNGQSNTYVCAVCGFSCASKFHYNSHMNTHGDHQCSMCDYTSRTEGRLKKHMRESHTVEDQLAAGLELSPPAAPATAASATTSPVKADSLDIEMPSAEGAATAPGLLSPATLSSTLLGMLNSASGSSMSALEQMRAITEQPLMGDGSTDGLLVMGNPLGLTLPVKEEVGSSGGRRKMKVYKCKQCIHVSTSKEEQWAHARTHIPCDKQMSCHKCNFVTEYKHHLEYHLRNHEGVKPFQCKKCNYTCVNKSMLNSHMKSHSNVYQFRCADCAYATKYCHSLKLHLKKYAHRRNTEGLTETEILMSMSAESSPPNMRKDSTASISSSMSGPFTPFGFIKKEEPSMEHSPLSAPISSFQFPVQSMPTSDLSMALMRQHQIEQMLANIRQQQEMQRQQAEMQQMQQEPVHRCQLCNQVCGSQEEMMRHNLTHLFANYSGLGVQASLAIPDRSAEDDHHTTTGSPSGDDAVSHSNGSAGSPLGSGRGSGDEGESGSSRRKSSKPSRIDEIGLRLIDKASPEINVENDPKEEVMETEEPSATASITASSSAIVLPPPAESGLLLPAMQQHVDTTPTMASLRQAYLNHLMNQNRQPAEQFRYECGHCKMAFQDRNMHMLHMTYHSSGVGVNPMMCSRCGIECNSALHFHLHLLQTPHI
ncbi:hypothetical protein PFISCL1PPCAC_24891 [Pristionchus fissidentatus]|uniref:C2H2-type domain-containing protein n=1 Tax=Pristionchus fissidentatus TaxID=1538716 RepID=A0AAV5WVF7_9BILA|nr:hypothetical protein PFISCL1PPCAC_24891 [Pristionchus fissidentatus]